ncbi:F-type H+-transporting ATPase subunit gamma [Poseidonocella pacifica]|uniref:F-type H+-transporting ATPase subunit gamma n=1 Tax=Poseidonocella pacifica TaxID=871651 RepID=A0A1I0V0P8_9RHOB|nr:FoF1 ATP synthase subunit gamma [Poseidonocella pacifica]SFA69106.1 F-type H+-transporting ATPase subunit gamma [Poseidonocella pacifica]
MPQTLETLTRQMGSMESIHSVVRTMKTLSVINSAPYEQAGRAIEAYHRTVLSGLHGFIRSAGTLKLPAQKVNVRVLVVFGTDHGLCGSYNAVLAAYVAEQLDARQGAAPRIACVGAQMSAALADRAIAVDRVFLPPASVDGIGRLANLLTRYLDGVRLKAAPSEIAVDLLFIARADGGGQEVRSVPLLPLDTTVLKDLKEKPWDSRSLPTFAMKPTDLFRALIRGYVFASLFKASAEAMVTENAARLALMQQAEQSIEERLEALRSDANALRQSGITTELLDVITGFEALKKTRRRKPAQGGGPAGQALTLMEDGS